MFGDGLWVGYSSAAFLHPQAQDPTNQKSVWDAVKENQLPAEAVQRQQVLRCSCVRYSETAPTPLWAGDGWNTRLETWVLKVMDGTKSEI